MEERKRGMGGRRERWRREREGWEEGGRDGGEKERGGRRERWREDEREGRKEGEMEREGREEGERDGGERTTQPVKASH